MRLENGKIQVEVVSLGAELQHLSVAGGQNCLWQVDEQHWNRVAPLLFPIVGKLKNDEAQLPEGRIKLRQHGFARDAEFSVKHHSPERLVLSLVDSDQTRMAYPFGFELELEYRLTDDRLNVEYTVHNTGKSDMPFSIGAHPGFALRGPLEEHRLVFEEPIQADRHWIEKGLYTGASSPCLHEALQLPLRSEDFKEDAIVIKHSGLRCLRLEHRETPLVEMRLQSARDFPYWGFWTKPGAPFFCLEPWAGLADSKDSNGDFWSKEGMLRLKPGAEQKFSYSLKPF